MPGWLLHRVLPIPGGSPWEEPDCSHVVWLTCWTLGKGAVVFMKWYSNVVPPTGQGVPYAGSSQILLLRWHLYKDSGLIPFWRVLL